MKKKIKADSVDELFEIVKAIQNGEEPEAYVKRKAEEERAARLAAQKAEEAERAAAKEARKAAQKAEEMERAAAQKARRAAQKAEKEENAAAREARRTGQKAEEAETPPHVRSAADRAANKRNASHLGGPAERADAIETRRAAQKIREPERSSAEEAGRAQWESEEQADFAAEETQKAARQGYREEDAFERELEEENGGSFEDVLAALRGYLTQAGSFITSNTQVLGEKFKGIGASAKKNGEKAKKTVSSLVKSVRERVPKASKSQTKQEEPILQEEPVSQKERVSQKEPISQKKPVPQKESAQQEEPVHNLGRVRLADTVAAETVPTAKTGKTRRRYGAKSVSEEAETVGRRILHSLHMEPSGEKQQGKTRDSSSTSEEEPMDLETLQILDRILDHPAESPVDGAADTKAAAPTGIPASSAATGAAAPASAPAGSAAPAGAPASPVSIGVMTPTGVPAGSVSPEAAAPTDAPAGVGSTEAMASTDISAGTMTSAGILPGGAVVSSDMSAAVNTKTGSGRPNAFVNTADPSVETADTSAKTADTSVETANTSAETADTSAGTADISAKTADPTAGITDPSAKTADTSVETADTSAGIAGTSNENAGISTDTSRKPHLPDLRKSLEHWKQTLAESGNKAVRLGGAMIILIVVLVVVALSLTNHILTIQKKKKYVTADQGLNLLVENQPEEWCSSCELQLKISVKSGTISSVTIGGISCTLDENGYVTVDAEEEQLEAVVVTDTETLTATIEIPMLDAGAPTLTAEKSGGEITLTAEDDRSGAETIWYAVLDDGDWLQLPVYQKYDESITFEEDKTYYFYATDQAGNRSTPLVTSMETAESISVSASELSLFEGETGEISAEVNPSGALYTGLSYASSNTAVATVSASGVVTAVAAGSAVIQVSADGLEAVSCQVNVVSEQTVTISAIGDCTLGTYAGSVTSTNFDTYYSMYGASYFFENVREILENDDFTFANLEGTLTDETTPLDKTYAFKGDPSYTEILLDGSIEVVTLANNHSSDYGSQSLVDTKENLTSAGIEYCIGDTIAYEEISGVKAAFIGIYELSTGLECESQVRETIAEAQEEGAQLIIVAFHWGTEKETAADETQQSLAHTAIDCGADLVVGHHPHVLQGIEKYNGKYIVYSLGNFCFGGNSNPSDKDTMIFRQTFTITSDGVADDDAIEIIPCTLSSASGYNDYRPTPATGSAADEIMDRINEYSSAFGDIVYTASTGV
ncbi:MAG: CapA family protein [Lachnospiraceae bacterium]|nr:CapA family protein [Lachnospiraceae bacterium]